LEVFITVKTQVTLKMEAALRRRENLKSRN